MNKLLLLSNMYPSEKSPGHGIFVKNIEQMLAHSGIDIKRAVVYGRHNNLLAKALAYMRFMCRAMYELCFSKRTVYIHFVAHSSLPLLLMSLFKRFRVIAHVHGGDVLPALYEPAHVRQIKRWLACKTLNKAQLIIVPSQWFKHLLVVEYLLEANLIEVNPSGGVDTEWFKPLTNHHKFNPAQTLKLGYVGRLDKGKGVETLLRALQKTTLAVQCEIVGGGTEESKFKVLAEKLGLGEKVRFVGLSQQKKLVEHYRKYDFFIFPSEMDESLGLVGLEAMACGTPLIATIRAGMQDYQAEAENTLGFESGNPASLVAAIAKASSLSAAQYRAMSLNARQTAERFDAKASNAHLLKLLAKF